MTKPLLLDFLESFWSLALYCVVILESIVLRTLMRETVRLNRMYCGTLTSPATEVPTLRMPPFSANLLDSPVVLTHEALRGRQVLFLFIDSQDASSLLPNVFEAIVQRLWSHTEGCLYLICGGNEAQCRHLRDHHQLVERYGDAVRILVDDSYDLMARFGIDGTPSAILFNENGKTEKRGYLSSQSSSGEIIREQTQ